MGFSLRHGRPERTQPRKTIEDIIGLERNADYITERITEITGGEFLRSDSKKQIHFTEHLSQYEAEEENLDIASNRILIQNLTIFSTQQLKFRIYLYATKDFYHVDENQTKIVDYIDIDLEQYGVRYKNSGLWMYPVTDMNLLYVDMNRSKKLHIAIENLSTAPKIMYGDNVLMVNVMYDVVS